jgi:flavin reductase (DIM6/NTAB) family NADH-FMN oxidoreductase RutF
MSKIKVDYKDYFSETIERMCDDGLLLVTKGNDNKANIMTIGWGTIGSIWGRPTFIVLVRPSRYTYSRLEEVDEFTVNVPSKSLAKAALHCGTVSGRDHDKFKEMSLTETASQEVQVPIIEECHINYECRSIHKNDLIPDVLDDVVKKQFYPECDFHRLYFGEILATYVDEK